jgi:hypothetical protein
MLKNTLVFLVAVFSMALVIGLMYNLLPRPIAWSLGFYVMVLIGYPLQRTYKSHPVPFARWAILCAICAGAVAIPVGLLMQRVL